MKMRKNGATYAYGETLRSKRRSRRRAAPAVRTPGGGTTAAPSLIFAIHAPRGRRQRRAEGGGGARAPPRGPPAGGAGGRRRPRPRRRRSASAYPATLAASLRNCFHDAAPDCLCCSIRCSALLTAVWMSPWCGPRICGFSFSADVAKIFPTGALLKNGFRNDCTAL